MDWDEMDWAYVMRLFLKRLPKKPNPFQSPNPSAVTRLHSNRRTLVADSRLDSRWYDWYVWSSVGYT
jgi:hypothetical protein